MISFTNSFSLLRNKIINSDEKSCLKWVPTSSEKLYNAEEVLLQGYLSFSLIQIYQVFKLIKSMKVMIVKPWRHSFLNISTI